MSEDTGYKVMGGVRFMIIPEVDEGDRAEVEEWVYSCTVCDQHLISRGSAGQHARTHDG